MGNPSNQGHAPEDVRRLAEERAAARSASDFGRADALRDELAERGWTVRDDPDGFRLERAAEDEPGEVRAADVASVLDEPATADVSVQWLVEGWPEDVERGLTAFRKHLEGRRIQLVVTDVTGEDPRRWGVEPTGDVLGPIEAVLADPTVGVAGPFGIVTKDLRAFDEAQGPGDVDAIEGYLMAFRREVLADAGLFDEKFKWYRTADIELSFRVKDRGLRAVVVPVPVEKHEHRMWASTPEDRRASWSKRNYYRFLDRWRDRWDLCVAPEPPEHDHHDHHDHDDH
jgi:cysteinyl-tRNA synthetase